MKNCSQKILSNLIINVSTSFPSCQWGAQMLADWGATIIQTNFCDLGKTIQMNKKKLIESMIICITDIDSIIPDNKNIIEQNKIFIPTIVLTDSIINGAQIAAISGHLITFGQNQVPLYPDKLIEILGATGLAIRILAQLQNLKNSYYIQNNHNRNVENRTLIMKPIIKLSLLEIIKYHGAFNSSAVKNGMIRNPTGKNILDGGAPFYGIYECASNSYVAVGNLEPKFYHQMIKGLNLNSDIASLMNQNQLNQEFYPQMKTILSNKFKQKTADQWESIMAKYDTCITKIVDFKQTESQKLIEPKLLRPKL